MICHLNMGSKGSSLSERVLRSHKTPSGGTILLKFILATAKFLNVTNDLVYDKYLEKLTEQTNIFIDSDARGTQKVKNHLRGQKN